MMLAKRVAALLSTILIVMLLTGMVALAMMPAKARAAEAGGETTGMITAAVTPAKPQAADEEISYELNDSYGDGWNGARITIVDTADNSTLATLTIDSGNHADGAVSLVRGHVYQFIWGSGNWNSECSFTFKSGGEAILEGGGDGRNDGEVLLTYMAGSGPYAGYNLWVANTRIANVNEADVLGDGTVSYDADTKTLTLDNCVCVRDGGDSAKSALIYVDNAEGPITINLKGNNVLEGGPDDQYGIYASAGATITGDGSLTVIGGGSGSGSTNSFGIYSLGNITLDGSFTGTVIAKGGATAGQSTGFSGSNVIVNGGTLIAVGGVGVDGNSIGLHAGTSLSVTGGTVVAQGGTVAKGNSIGVNLGNNATIGVSGGVFLVQGGNTSDTSGYSRGVNCSSGGKATFSGGAVVVRAGAVGTGSSRYSSASHRTPFENCDYVSNGMTSVKVGYDYINRFVANSNVTRYTTGFACVPSSWKNLSEISSAADGAITLSNDGYYINTSKDSPATALPSLDANGHTLFVANLFEGDPNDRAAGLVLSSSGDVSLTGSGSVVAVGGLTTADPSFGLYASGSLTVTGPTVIGVSGQSNNDSDGVCCAAGSLTVSSGKVIGVGSSPNSSSNDSHGVNVNQGIAASGAAFVAGLGGIASSAVTYGIKAQGVTAHDSASVLGIGGSASGSGANSNGVSANSVEVAGGALVSVGGDHAAGSCGLNGGDVVVRRGGSLIAVGGTQATDSSCGIGGLADDGALELKGSAAIAGTTGAIGSSDGTLLLDKTGLALGYTDFAGTADEALVESGAELSTLSGYRHVKVTTPPGPMKSGECGTCYWEITPDKVLRVYPGALEPAQDTHMPWYPTSDSTWQLSDIEQVVMVSRGANKVVAPSDSKYILSQLSYVKSMDLSGLDTSQAQDLSHLFASSDALESLDVSMLDTSKATTMKSMFQDCSQLGRLNLSALDMTKVTDASNMFSGCTSLASLSLPTSGMASVADASSMFSGCTSLASLDLSAAGMGNVVDASSMFSGCTSLASLDLSALDMAKVTCASNMFAGCTSLTGLSFPTAGMASVTDASGMFLGCTSLEGLNLPTGSLASVADASNMFAGCTSLASLDLSAAGMASVTDASDMFSGCSSLKSLDLSTVDMTKVTDTSDMFSGCTSLESIKLGSACKLASNVALGEAPTAHPYTGKWIRQEGGEPLTAAELMSTYDGLTMAGTYVWQQIVQRSPEELNQLITTATTTSPYKDVDTVQVSTDGSEVFLVDMWVTQEMKDALVAAIVAAQGVAGNEEATQEQRDDAYYALEAAMANYVPKRGTKEKELVEATTWSRLYELLQENGSNIKLASDVKFGTGGGEHESDALVVPAGFIASIDLNGHIVDRDLGQATEAVEGGSVLDVFGELTIKDSRPTATHNPAFTFTDPLNAENAITVTGGIITGGYAVLKYESSSNWYFGGGGVLVENNAHLAMTGGSICRNHVTASQGSGDGGGGGVAVMPNGSFDMSGTAAVCGNLADDDGGGVFMANAVLNMDENASICFNTAGDHGGGVYALRCSVSMKGDSRINGNKAHAFGGGAYFYYSSSLVMEDNAEIASNHTDYHGGGVAMYSFIATEMSITMKDKSRIYANSCNDDGGGVFLGTGKVVLNMSDESSISGNFASSEGGGVYANGGTLNMYGGEINGNSSNGSGGGVCLGNLNGGSALHMSGGTITGNSTHGSGGGVYAHSNARAFTLEGTVVVDDNEIVDENGNHVSENNIHGAAESGSSMNAPVTVTGALGEGSSIGITQWGVPGEDLPLDAVSGFAENNPDCNPASVFTSDSSDYIVIVSADGEPQLALPEGVGIWIGGKRVSVLNASDVFGDGKVSYDQATKTLTLNGYHFDGYGEMTHHAALATTVENLTVNVVGENKIVESGWFNWDAGTDCFGIWAANGLVITGSGTLEAWAYYMNTNETTGAGIFVASGDLTIGEGFTGELLAHANRGIGVHAAGDVLIAGGEVKFYGEQRAVEAVTVSLGKNRAAYGSAEAGAEDGVVLATNTGADPLNITAQASATYKTIWTKPLVSYDLWVNGEQFSNAKLTIACGGGTAVFDPEAETPTLTLTNATIGNHPADSAMNAGIYSELSELVIKTVGTSVIKPTGSGVDGVLAAGGCNVAVVGEGDEPGSLALSDVECGFNVGGDVAFSGLIVEVDAKSDCIRLGRGDDASHTFTTTGASGKTVLSSSEGTCIFVAPVADGDHAGEIRGTIDVGGSLEMTSAVAGTNVPDSAITLAEGWGYTKGASLTQRGKVVIGEVVTVTFDGNGHGGVLATLQVPKGKSVNDAFAAMSEEAQVDLTDKIACELSDGDKRYQVIDYCSSASGAISMNWDAPLDKDATFFAKWLECITLVEIAVEPPVCGTATETGKDSQGNWDFSKQTNKPVGNVVGTNYILMGDENGWNAGWAAGSSASVIANPDAIEPYIGGFTGGVSYTLAGSVQTLEGYLFSKDVVAKVNGEECAVFMDTSEGIMRRRIGIVGEVTAAHVVTEEPTAAEVPATCGSAGTKAYWECSACGRLSADAAGTSTIDAPQTIPATGNHSWDAGAVTQQPTDREDGVRTFTCTTCGATKTEAIPKVALGADGTELGAGASATIADMFLTTKAVGEVEPAGTVFSLLQARAKKLGKTSIKLGWTKVRGAVKYVIYGAKCGKGTKRVKIATTTSPSIALAKVAGQKVMPKTFYKFNVVALDAHDRVVSTSKTIHVVTKGNGKYCNESKVTVKKSVKTKAKRLKVGKSLKLKAKAVRAKKDARKKLKLARHRAIAYESSNPKIATVTPKGVVSAKKKGTCYVYAYAQSGVFAKVKVVVK